jgi:thioredoxin 1
MLTHRSAVRIVLTLALVVVIAAPLLAQESARDQSTGAEATTSVGCGSPPKGSLYQSFTPTAATLGAVSLQFRPGNAFPPAGCPATVKVRAGKTDGEVIGSATATVPPPGAVAEPTVIFAFEPPLKLAPGQVYVIEWLPPEGGDAALSCMATEKDTYSGGTAFGPDGTALAGQDLAFATFKELPNEAQVAAKRASIAEELAAGDKLIGEGDIPGAMAHYRRVLEVAQTMSAESLTGDDRYAVGTAHYYLMAEAFDQALQAGGLDAERKKTAQAWRDQVLNPQPSEPVEVVKVIGHGERVNLMEYVVQGKATIVDFYSEFCGPCRKISPLLEQLAHTRDDVVVVKVDINRPGVQGIDWTSPVAQQYGLQSIPNFKIFGPDGKLQAEGDAAYQWIARMVNLQ